MTRPGRADTVISIVDTLTVCACAALALADSPDEPVESGSSVDEQDMLVDCLSTMAAGFGEQPDVDAGVEESFDVAALDTSSRSLSADGVAWCPPRWILLRNTRMYSRRLACLSFCRSLHSEYSDKDETSDKRWSSSSAAW